MKAVVYDRYGGPDLLRLEEVATPTPRHDEVLIRVRAVSLNRSDWEILRGEPLYARVGGPFKPRHRILGSDVAGRVEATGRDVSRFRPGDDVFGDNLERLGGFAEYACAREKALALKPDGMTFEEVAAIPQGGVIALQGIRDKGQVQPGQQVLINGAGGSAGTFAVQLAKLYGAEVTAVDHTDKMDFLRRLGADHFLDYTRKDFTKSGRQYDVILDVVADRSALAYRRALKPNGRYLLVGGPMATLLQVLLLGPLLRGKAGKRIRVLMVRPNLTDLVHVTELCRTGTIAPVIDRRFPLSEVPEALRYLGEGRAKGKIVITLDAD